MKRLGEKWIRRVRRSRACAVALTVAAWFALATVLGALSSILNGGRYPMSTYIYNAFTIFSNLGDDLNLASAGGAPHFPAMLVNAVLIVSGMIGIALLTATVTKDSIDMDEERFDAAIDEFRRMAALATSPGPKADAHRILARIIRRIHRDVMPARNNTSVHGINVYEFEYIFVDVIGRILKERRLLDDPPELFAPYAPGEVERIVAWAEGLDSLAPLFHDSSGCLMTRQFQRAWRLFAMELPERIRGRRAAALSVVREGVNA